MTIPRYDAIETFDIKLEQAKAMLRVLACAFTDPSRRPTQATAVFALQAAGDLIEESQRIIEPVIQHPAMSRASISGAYLVGAGRRFAVR